MRGSLHVFTCGILRHSMCGFLHIFSLRRSFLHIMLQTLESEAICGRATPASVAEPALLHELRNSGRDNAAPSANSRRNMSEGGATLASGAIQTIKQDNSN